MEIHSIKIGTVSYREEDVFYFPSGVLGFEDEKHFILVPTENVEPFVWLQSIATPSLAFLLIDPRLILPDYQLELRKEDLREIEIETGQDALIHAIVTVPQNPRRMTANLKGPLVFNLKKRLCMQVIIENADLRHPLFAEDEQDAESPGES